MRAELESAVIGRRIFLLPASVVNPRQVERSPRIKLCTWLMAALCAVALSVAGCGKKSGVNTSALTKSFESADAMTIAVVDETVAAIENADYVAAMTKLQRLATDFKLTPAQEQAVKDVIEQGKKV